MRDGSRLLGWLVLLIVILGNPPAALAEFLTPLQTRYAPLTDTDWSLQTPLDQNGIATPFEKFVPLGDSALKSVIINILWRADSTFNMHFTTASTITLSTSGSLVIQGPDGQPLLTGLPEPLFTNTQVLAQTSPGDVPFATKIFSGSSQIVLTDAASLALYTSTGLNDLTFKLPIFASAQSDFLTSSGNGFGQTFTKIAAIVSIQFAVVPEPGSLILLGSGGATCLVVCLFRRRFAPR